MNYTFRQLALDFFAARQVDAPKLAEGIVRMLSMYAGPVTAVNQNLLGSHDVPRFLTLASEDSTSLELATVFQFTMPGAPGLYYGDEVGMVGGEDPGQRGAFPWHEPETWLNSQLETVRSLSALRRATPALERGSWRLINAEGRAISYRRDLDGSAVIVVINDGDQPATIEVPASEVLWGRASIGPESVEIPARSAAILS